MLDALTRRARSTLLVDTGEHDEALEVAAEMAPRLEASGDVFDLVAVRAAQARILALRGQGAPRWPRSLDWLESTARGTEDPQLVVCGLGSAALARAALGQDEAAAALLAELEAYPGARDNQYYADLPPRDGAHRPGGSASPSSPSVSSAVSSPATPTPSTPSSRRTPPSPRPAGTCRQPPMPTPMPPIAGSGSGSSPSRRSRSSARAGASSGSSRPTEAAPALQHAREIFERLQAAPALAETDALLQQATALSS